MADGISAHSAEASTIYRREDLFARIDPRVSFCTKKSSRSSASFSHMRAMSSYRLRISAVEAWAAATRHSVARWRN
jgi:hypothetical protein